MSGRIGKVRMKATGFEFRVIEGPKEPETDSGARLIGAAREIATDPSLIGYVLIGLTKDGGYRSGYQWSEDSPIPRTLFPTYMAEVLRRELITDIEAENVFNSMFQWVD